MTGPRKMHLFDRDEEPTATEESDLRQQLPSSAAVVRADSGGNIVSVEIDVKHLQQVSTEAFTAQLATAIQQVQERAADQLRHRRQPNKRRGR